MNAAPCFALTATPDSAVAPANLFAAPAETCAQGSRTFLSAWLDKSDRVVHLSPAWDDEVAPAFRQSEILARPVGWFVADPNVRECYRKLLARVRQEHRATKLAVRFDAPFGEPRAMQLAMMPLSAGAIELVWSSLSGDGARRIESTPRRAFEEGELLRMCGWCHDVNLGMRWRRLEASASELGLLDHAALPAITHGICPACCGAVAAETVAHRALAMAV